MLLPVSADHPQFITAFGPSVDGVVVGGRMSEEEGEVGSNRVRFCFIRILLYFTES